VGRVGAIPGEYGGSGDGWGRADLPLEQMEAAVELGADTDFEASR
jgi:hypothetical protein